LKAIPKQKSIPLLKAMAKRSFHDRPYHTDASL
jgi:hypothetical protein